MNQIVVDVLWQMGAYIFVFITSFFLFNKLMGGLLMNWLKVRSNQQKKILTKVRTLIVDYYVAGLVLDGMLVYKDKVGAEKRLSLSKGSVYRSIGVNCVDVDEEKNCVVVHDFEKVSGFDAEKHNSLYLRALYKPTLNDQKLLIVILVVGVLLAMIMFGSIYLNYTSQGEVMTAIEGLKQVSAGINTQPLTGGA